MFLSLMVVLRDAPLNFKGGRKFCQSVIFFFFFFFLSLKGVDFFWGGHLREGGFFFS